MVIMSMINHIRYIYISYMVKHSAQISSQIPLFTENEPSKCWPQKKMFHVFFYSQIIFPGFYE